MADITKCKGEDCPLKESCYRYTAPYYKHIIFCCILSHKKRKINGLDL